MTQPKPSDAFSPQGEQQPDASPSPPASLAEWVSLAAASVLLSGVIGLVGYLWANDQQRQPAILQVTRSATRQGRNAPFASSQKLDTESDALRPNLRVHGALRGLVGR